MAMDQVLITLLGLGALMSVQVTPRVIPLFNKPRKLKFGMQLKIGKFPQRKQ